MQRLSRDVFTTILDPQLPPAITVASGEALQVETWDAYMGAWGVDEEPQVTGPASGPIAVEGASPGDTLRIDILAIEPGPAAMHDVRAGRGFLGDTFTQRYPTVMDIQDGHLLFPGGIKIPIRPSIGLIATTPAAPQQTASDSGPYGGDLDIQELTENSTIWLPVFVPGGLLVLGDCHAVVGDGAVGGTGAECAADLTLRLTVEKEMHIERPRALTPDHFITIAYGEDLTWAMQQAVQDMVDFLVQDKGMSPYDAYSLLSLAGNVRMSRTLREISPVKMMLSRHILEQIG
ncbi:MAG: acetamidase/formamidase family protein [Candidatus Tectomicrobia bacterium]|nr:acetamidase/formamidase family protein [Candidatus Tectomicrobia bacterium]